MEYLCRLLKNAPAYRQAGISGVIRSPHRLGGVATSRSLFVATPPLILRRCNVHSKYASLFRISGALHLGIFGQPEKNDFFNRLSECRLLYLSSVINLDLKNVHKIIKVYSTDDVFLLALANPSPLLIECCRWVGNPKLLGKPRCTNY
jgi:hypothetical protein